MHFATRGYLLVALTALLAIAGTWSDQPAFESAWLFPAFLLLTGLALEAWYAHGTRVQLRMAIDERLKLGREARAAFAFAHNRRRDVELQYGRALPPALRQSEEVRRVVLPPLEEWRDEIELLPLRLGPHRFRAVPSRLLGRLSLAWWSRELAMDGAFSVAPDSLPRGARAIAGESAGETPRRLPGAGVELLQLREYVSGDALSRIDWKATARRGTLISREYSEAQHLEVLVVIDASRASRVRAGALDRLGLYANVAARLAEHAVSVEDRVGLLVYSDRVHAACVPDRGTRAVTRLRRALELLDAGERGEADPMHAALQARRMLRSRGLVVWLTDLAEPVRTESLVLAMKVLAPRHQPVIAAPRAAEIATLAAAPATGWRDPGVALAARETHAAAQRQAAVLRRQGVIVLDEPDDELDESVYSAYLQLRRRRRV